MSTPDLAGWRAKFPAAPYIVPFALFLFFLAAAAHNPLPLAWEGAVRVLFLLAVCAFCWPPDIALRPVRPIASIAVGIAVFVLWIAPDFLIPGYRNFFLFTNPVLGGAHTLLPPASLASPSFLFWRFLRAVVVVPIVEELFWRGWLLRWLIQTDFRRVPLGTYTPFSFWVTAVLFASEHGPYWDVGLLTGVVYNAWMVRSKSLPSCILMHAITNALLSAYVISAHQWQYWQ